MLDYLRQRGLNGDVIRAYRLNHETFYALAGGDPWEWLRYQFDRL